jgi:predicted ATPase
VILKSVEVKGFRSFRESQTCHIDRFVTVLIGANDHGKSNLLRAINALNGDFTVSVDDRNWDTDETDYPEQPFMRWRFELSDDERAGLTERLRQRQTAQRELKEAEDAQDEAEESDDVESQTETTSTSPSSANRNGTSSASPSQQAVAAVGDDQDADEAEDEGEEDISIPEVTDAVLRAASELREFAFVRRGADSEVEVELPDTLTGFELIDGTLLDGRPRIEAFEGTTTVSNSTTLADLERPENEFMQGIFRKAGIWANRRTLFQQTPKSSRTLDEASKQLTERIREEWQQGRELEFRLIHAGTNGDRIDLQIRDPSVGSAFVLPTQRSAGFSAFFGMSMAMFARKEAKPANNYVFIFDEPATALHPHGQVNVQSVFEALARKNQIIYSTHSIFMVSKNFPTRNRTVTKLASGTKIDHKPYIGNWKAVRSNLGLLFTNNFFVADTTLLVEGPSEQVYIASLLRSLDRLKKIDVDLNLFSIEDCGTVVDALAMAKLMLDEGRQVVLLVDGDGGGGEIKKKAEALNKALAKSGRQDVVHVIQLPKDSSIENVVLYPQFYIDAVAHAVEELVANGIRTYDNATDPATVRAAVEEAARSTGKGKTLGKTIEDVSKTWFEPADAVSKLLVARLYDERVETAETATCEKGRLSSALALAQDIIKQLRLPQKQAKESVIADGAA